ncbi:ABC transporter ATP-binding protein [Bacillus cereus]|nr:ABC transporter ATP-binding protein [Bacillus cereus]WJE53125.1 ABC transporter ATP-binding protein [Bacillus cereus]
MTYIVEILDVNIEIKKKEILRNINLKFEKGKIYGLLGPNGAGKTTLLKSLLGVFKPNIGTVIFNGHDIYNSPNVNVMKNIGSIIEFPGFYANLTLSENMALHMRYHNIIPKQEEIDRLLNFVGLYQHKDKLFSQTSLGMKQRMGIARSIANDPILLLLDEPTNGLDPQGIKQVREMLIQEVELNDRTIIVSSHLLNEINLIADKLIFMNNGLVKLTIENKKEMNLFKIYVDEAINEKTKKSLESKGLQFIQYTPSYVEIVTSLKEAESLKWIKGEIKVNNFKNFKISLEDLYLYLLSESETKGEAQYAIN